MCGGPSDADACFECFECNKHETGCVPISGCESSVCEEDSDCERGQICYNNDCALRTSPFSFIDVDDSIIRLIASWSVSNWSIRPISVSQLTLHLIYCPLS